jgi:DNA-binding CsgD family transcriptional regulator/energy-coupling factor transporter ATP-binding protein EcfA2
MVTLRGALAEAEEGRGGVTVLAGEAGVGKSRLLRELAGLASSRRDAVLIGRAVQSGVVTPYRPLAEALLQGLRGTAWPDASGREPWDAALRDVLSMQPDGAQQGPRPARGFTPVVRGEAIVRLLRMLAATSPILLGLEDLQWADADTLAVVEYLADNLHADRVLGVVTVRSEPRSAASELTQVLATRRTVRLMPLPSFADEDARRMVLACRPSASPEEVRRVVDAADGLPFLIEELLAAPGVPRSLADSVAARLARLDEGERRVIQVAAVVGRQFDWRLLATAAEETPEVVAAAIERAVGDQILTADGGAYRFRHPLTRDAVVNALLPHLRAGLAHAALAAVDAAHPRLPDSWRDVVADLAMQSGDVDRAAGLLIDSGHDSLGRGGLATAIDALRRASGLARLDRLRHDAQAPLVEALALAGRVDECLAAGETLLRWSASDAPAARAGTHLTLAQAAAEASRWPLASRHLAAAEELLAAAPDPVLTQRCRVLAAEHAIAIRDVAEARRLAQLVLQSDASTPEVRCHAFELLGRSHRARDLAAARAAFEDGLACSAAADLPVWRLRALHELGTIELFDRAGVDRLREARRTAEELGALSTAVFLDLQLTAAYIFRFDPGLAIQHATSAHAEADRLHLDQVRATALVFLAEAHGLRRDEQAMERHNILALAAAPGDDEIAGSVWGGRGVAALLAGDTRGARRGLQRAAELLGPLPNAGPALYLGLWPLLLAVEADSHAHDAVHSARRAGITVNRANRGLLLLAEAVLAGREEPTRGRAGELAERAAVELAHVTVWSHLARLLAAQAALADEWGEPRRWLAAAAESFGRHGIEPLVQWCDALLAEPAQPLSSLGITPREREVLGLVALGLSNRDIAARLFVSHRTVEKHVESLLRKTGARSRTQLVVVAAGAARRGDG